MAILPEREGDFEYRVRSSLEPRERVVAENKWSLRPQRKFDGAYESMKGRPPLNRNAHGLGKQTLSTSMFQRDGPTLIDPVDLREILVRAASAPARQTSETSDEKACSAFPE